MNDINRIDLNALTQMDRDYEDKSLLEDTDPDFDERAYRQDAGGMVTAHNGIADVLLKNDKLYNSMKGDWKRSDWNKSKNIRVTTGRENGKFYISREQMNVDAVAERCKRYREASEQGVPDPLAPLMPDGKIGFKWMDLPEVLAIRISDDYFGGLPWAVVKKDRTLKAQFYMVVQQEYPAFICYPGGRLPIPIKVPYPAKSGTTNIFKGATLL
jgi:hypothetical protein